MIDNKIIREIEDFVYSKPRSIQEISEHLKKNWRTADRYVEEIIKEYGTLGKRIFREGTRGALKIIYWASVEKVSHSVFQEEMEERIYQGKTKEDFFAFDIFQHVSDKNKDVWMKSGKDEVDAGRLSEFAELLRSAKKQILFFSGNLSFINFDDGKVDILDVIDELVSRGINIKILCRVDFVGQKNIEKVLALNFKHGKELIEIRHREQPLRATLIDGKTINLKEVRVPGERKEIRKKTFIIYTLKDKEWANWMSKLFWKMHSTSIGSKRRLEELRKIK
ncbi:MAG: hypothetical protein OEL87_02375 [Nanoarchaeota archaeon]|nr:hypothetical protein [Nanoarchaeota archaeon]